MEDFAALFEESLAAPGDAPGRAHHRRSRSRRLQRRRRQRRPQVRKSFIPIDEFKNDKGEIEVKPGDFVTVAIESLEDGYGETKLSRDKAKRLKAWHDLEAAMEQGSIVQGLVTSKVKGGLTVMINGIRAFLPGSLVDIRPVKDTIAVREQGARLQGHQARPQAQQRRRVAPRRARGERRARSARSSCRRCRKARSSRASSRTSPTTARSSTWAASTACCTSPTSPGAASSIRRKCSRSATKSPPRSSSSTRRRTASRSA